MRGRFHDDTFQQQSSILTVESVLCGIEYTHEALHWKPHAGYSVACTLLAAMGTQRMSQE